MKRQTTPKLFTNLAAVLVFMALLSSLLGLAAHLTWQRLRQESQQKRHQHLTQLLSEQIENIISQHFKTVQSLSRQRAVLDFLSKGQGALDPEALLETARAILDADIVYLINRQGIVVSSSQGKGPSILGRNLSFRPYFRDAWKGRTAVFPALDPDTGRVTLHFSTPVFGPSKEVVDGILATAFDIDLIEDLLYQRMEKIALISGQGIIFSTNNPAWQFHSTRELTPEIRQDLEETRQFSTTRLPFLELGRKKIRIKISGTSWNPAWISMPISGWEMVSLQKKNPNFPLPAYYRHLIWTGMTVTGGLALLTFFLLINIHHQKRIQIELSRTREKYASIFKNAVMGIYQSSLDGKFLDLNPAMAGILGFPSPKALMEQVNRIDYQVYLNPEDRAAFIRDVRYKQQVRGFETRLVRQDKSVIWVQLSGRLALDPESGSIFLEGFCIDITEKKAALEKDALRQQQLREADRMVSMGMMASGVAHEINNPNTFIHSNAQFLLDAWQDACPALDSFHDENSDFSIAGLPYGQIREKLPVICERILQGSRRIARIIKELRDYSRRDGPGIWEPIEVNQVIQSVLILVENMIKKTTLNFRLDLTENLPPVMGSAQRLEQVLVNIIQNSCQAVTHDRGLISVSSALDPDTGQVVITCLDQGIGIPETDLKQVIDPFFTTKRDAGGTGLGLSISSSIVQELGGTLKIRSRQGEGTRVCICLPCAPRQSTSGTKAGIHTFERRTP